MRPRRTARVEHPRQCIGCNVIADAGPLPYSWDVHQLIDATKTLICTCSSTCRRELGYPERKVSA